MADAPARRPPPIVGWLVAATVSLFVSRLWFGGSGTVSLDYSDVGKSKANVFVQKNIGVRFADDEGIDEAKTELMEVVQFLRDPGRYTKMGGHIPKGILIVGAPVKRRMKVQAGRSARASISLARRYCPS